MAILENRKAVTMKPYDENAPFLAAKGKVHLMSFTPEAPTIMGWLEEAEL